MSPVISVEVEQTRETILGVRAIVQGAEDRALKGALRVAHDIQSRARSNMATHHYTGRAEEAVTVWTGINPIGGVRVHVGIRGNTFAPEGKTFEVGWRSKRGLQPPTAPLAEWVMRRGIASTPAKAKSVGFAIARSMKRKGYSFGEFHWLSDAGGDALLTAPTIIERYMQASWASQPRSALGRFMSFAAASKV